MAVLDLLDIVNEHREKLYAFIRSRVPGEEDSWDILQDVFAALTARWNLGDTLEDGAAWLFRVARNRIVDLYRQRSRSEISLEGVLGIDREGFSAELEDPDGTDPSEHDGRSELRGVLLSAIRELPPEQREILKQTELEGRKFRVVAQESGVPIGTLLARKRYAVQKLNDAIRSYESEGKGDR